MVSAHVHQVGQRKSFINSKGTLTFTKKKIVYASYCQIGKQILNVIHHISFFYLGSQLHRWPRYVNDQSSKPLNLFRCANTERNNKIAKCPTSVSNTVYPTPQKPRLHLCEVSLHDVNDNMMNRLRVEKTFLS